MDLTNRARRALVVIGASLIVLAVASALYLRPSLRLPASSQAAHRSPATQVADLQLRWTFWQSADDGWLVFAGPLPDISILYGTTDGGRHWARLARVQGYLVGLEFVDRATGFAQLRNPPGPSSTFLRSDDGGRHWRPISSPPNSAGLFVAPRFVDPNHGWALVTSQTNMQTVGIFQTEDGGMHWGPLASVDQSAFDPMLGPPDLTFANRQVGWLTTSARNGPVLYRTDDGGRAWSPIEVPVPPAVGLRDRVVRAARPVVAGRLGVLDVMVGDLTVGDNGRRVVTAQQGWTYHSSDGGLTWQDPTPVPDPEWPIFSQPAHAGPAIAWYVGGNRIWVSSDQGHAWEKRGALPRPWWGVGQALYPFGAGTAWCLALPKDPSGMTGQQVPQADTAPALFRTSDGGRSWSRMVLPETG